MPEIEVQLRRGVRGCVWYPVGCLTLGFAPLIAKLGERHFVRRMTEDGLETRSGKRIGWNQITSVTFTRGVVGGPSVYGGGGTTVSYEYILTSPAGKASVPLWRTVNQDEVRAFFLAHVPRHLLSDQGVGG